MLRTACVQNKRWQDAALPPCVVSVNVSPRQFRRDDLNDCDEMQGYHFSKPVSAWRMRKLLVR